MTEKPRNGGRSGTLVLVAAILTLCGQAEMLHAQDEAGETQSEEHGGHGNSVALFLGPATHLSHGDESSETGGAIGLEYARRVTDWLKIGALAEWASTDRERDFVFVLPFFAHLTENFALVAGPGLEVVSLEEGHEDEKESEFVFRFGTIYEFEVGSWAIGPQVNADSAGGRWTLVYGVSFGKGF